MNINTFLEQLSQEIQTENFGENPPELYEPIRYIMSLGGKRMRPLLCLLGYALFEKDVEKVLKPAIAIEVFHNFTLMHDDIMDNAPLRRGQATVHEKWDNNVAILSGDVMLVRAYEILLSVEDKYLRQTIQMFNKCASEVCEGQQIDMNFECRDDVSEAEYLDMIRLKTAVLLGFSLALGGTLAGTSEKNVSLLRQFGENMGIGFQLKDDLLDVYADSAKFGKQVGGDIIANKKTFLLIEALERAEGETAKTLDFWLKQKDFDPKEKVEKVTNIYNELKIRDLTLEKINHYFDLAFKNLEEIEAEENQKKILRTFTEKLINRDK